MGLASRVAGAKGVHAPGAGDRAPPHWAVCRGATAFAVPSLGFCVCEMGVTSIATEVP